MLRDNLKSLHQTASVPELLTALGKCLSLDSSPFLIERTSSFSSNSAKELVGLDFKVQKQLHINDLWADLEFSDEPISVEVDRINYLVFPVRLVDPHFHASLRLFAAGFTFSSKLSALTEDQLILIETTQHMAHQLSRLDAKEVELDRDSLTGLLNSRSLKGKIKSEIARAERFNGQFSLLFIDLDNFKQINDKFGHLAGTSVLSQTSEILKQDSREIDAIFRYGGDEFIVLLIGADPLSAKSVAERIRTRIDEARYFLEDGHHVSLTASIGIASFPQHRKSVDDLIQLADEMMYNGKKTGKNRVCVLESL